MKKLSALVLGLTILTSIPPLFSYISRTAPSGRQDYIESYLANLFAVSGAYGYETLQDIKNKDYDVYIAIKTITNRVLARLRPQQGYTAEYVAAETQTCADEYVTQHIRNVVDNQILNRECASVVTWQLLDRFSEVKNNYEKFPGDYTPFVGKSLRAKVQHSQHMCTPAPRPSAPYAPSIAPRPSLYDTVGKYDEPDCLLCFEPFNGTLKRVRFAPCGHSMCARCTREWFFAKQNTTCPTCRGVVDKTDLAYKL